MQSKGLSRVFSNTTVQKHQFFLLCGAGQIYIHFKATLVFIIIIGVDCPHKVVLVSAVPQPESAASVHTSLLFWAPLPAPPLEVITERQAELPVLHSGFPLAVCFAHGRVYKSVLLKCSVWTCAGFPPWVRARDANSMILLHVKCFHNITQHWACFRPVRECMNYGLAY